MANNQNIVDGDVEVLDLAELEQALGGASKRRLDPGGLLSPDAKRKLSDLLGTLKPGGGLRPGGGLVAIENDGWQGAAFEPHLLPTFEIR
ncbi:MAG: hypothetical protein RL685_995 [Pseudomonadota bacterium]|jgi:hypothetical protein